MYNKFPESNYNIRKVSLFSFVHISHHNNNNNNNNNNKWYSQSINVVWACLVSPDGLQDGEGEDGDTAGAADHVKYTEQTDQVQEWTSQVQLFQINNDQRSEITYKLGSIIHIR